MTVYLFVQVFLATILLVSAMAKWMDLAAFRRTLQELGLSEGLALAGSRAVPAAELVVACLLPWQPTRLTGALGLLGLVCGFAWANWRALSQKEALACNCFGALLPDAFGWKTVLRVVVLGIMTLILLLAPQPSGILGVPAPDVLFAVLLTIGLLLSLSAFPAYLHIRRHWNAGQAR